MKTSKILVSNKPKLSTTTAIAITLMMLSSIFTFMAISSVNAADVTVYPFLTVSPNPIGVGQQTIVVAWLDRLPPMFSNNTQTSWEQYTVSITHPDGETETLGPVNSDSLGSTYFAYTPTKVGTYIFTFNFPGQNAIDGNYYLPTTSHDVSLDVQADAVADWSANPLPTGYWERPIYGENREWYTIGGNWLGVPLTYGTGASSSGAFNPYTTAPESAHILWTKEIVWGGIVGGDLGDKCYYTGLSYESKYGPPIIMQGKLFYNLPLSNLGSSGGAVCVDLRTGEEIWQHDIGLSLGQIYHYDSPNQHGAIPYLWQTGSTYKMFDPFTGELLLTLENAVGRGARITMSPIGDMLVYVLDARNGWLAMWNSSYAQYNYPGTVGSSSWQWRPPIGTTQDWREGIQWNVTIPDDIPTSRAGIACIGEGVLVAAAQADDNTITAVGYSATTGAQKWAINITSNVANRPTYFVVPLGNGIFTFFRQETMEFYAYSIETGDLVWGPTEPYSNDWGIFTSSTGGLGASNPLIAYDTLYSVAYDGMIHAFDVSTGEGLWEFWTGSSGFETPYGTYPLGSGTFAIADGKVYAATGEHSPNSPMWRGGRIYAVDAYTGQGVWNLSGWWQNPAVADGYLVAFNNYDSQLYCIGKGLTETTVTASEAVQTLGTPVLIKGTVTDQSPGDTCLGIPAAGTPAIADEYMTEWMEYMYMQQEKPEDAEGVEVVITTVDPNGNTYELTRTTTDTNGNFGCVVEPSIAGKYKIIATFEGSESYFSSTETTYLWVEEASSPAQPIEPEPTEPTAEAPLITTELAIILAVVVVAVIGIAAYWQLRKRK